MQRLMLHGRVVKVTITTHKLLQTANAKQPETYNCTLA